MLGRSRVSVGAMLTVALRAAHVANTAFPFGPRQRNQLQEPVANRYVTTARSRNRSRCQRRTSMPASRRPGCPRRPRPRATTWEITAGGSPAALPLYARPPALANIAHPVRIQRVLATPHRLTSSMNSQGGCLDPPVYSALLQPPFGPATQPLLPARTGRPGWLAPQRGPLRGRPGRR